MGRPSIPLSGALQKRLLGSLSTASQNGGTILHHVGSEAMARWIFERKAAWDMPNSFVTRKDNVRAAAC